MRGALFMSGFLIFSFGMVLLLPSIIIDAAGSNIQTKGQAMSFILGNVAKNLNTNANDFSRANLLQKLPSLLVLVGLVLMVISFLIRF